MGNRVVILIFGTLILCYIIWESRFDYHKTLYDSVIASQDINSYTFVTCKATLLSSSVLFAINYNHESLYYSFVASQVICIFAGYVKGSPDDLRAFVIHDDHEASNECIIVSQAIDNDMSVTYWTALLHFMCLSLAIIMNH